MAIQKTKNKPENVSDLEISERGRDSLLSNGITTISQLCERTKQDLLKLKGFGKVSLDELLLALRIHKLKLKKKVKEVKSIEFEKYLIHRYIKPNKLKTINWGNEIKVAGNLISRYPKREFWEWYALTFKLNSLLFFFGGGKENLYKAYHSDQTKIPHINPVELKEEKKEVSTELVGENIITSKPKSIEEFLHGY